MSRRNLFKSINNQLFNFSKWNISVRSLAVSGVYHNILTSDSSDVVIPNVTISELIIPRLEKFEKYSASECAATGRKFAFGQIRSKSKNLSKALRHVFRLKKGDVVAIFLPNKPEYLIAMLGILEAGLVVTTLNPIYTPDEISRQLLDSSTKVIITHNPLTSTAQAAVKLCQRNIPIVAMKLAQNDSLSRGIIDFEEMVNLNVDLPNADYGKSSDLAILPYSSGTTGLPKGVQISHYNIVANICQAIHNDFNCFEEPTDSFQDVAPAALPFYHIYGMTMILFQAAFKGGKAVTLEKFSPELYISALKNHPVTIIYAAPPLVLFLASHPEVKSEYFKHLKMMLSGAAPLGFLDEERMIKRIGRESKIIQGYGLTETSPMLTNTPRNMKRSQDNAGSVGKPVSNTLIKVISPSDPTGTPLGANQSGEVLVKGPQVMSGYLNKKEENQNAFLDGWFRTGDIGYYNKDKLLYITDRMKELIKVKGFQVAPAELEEIIRDYPSVEDAAVIGIPHPKHGEVPRAYVVLKKNSTINVEDLKNHLSGKLAQYKRLEGGVNIVETIPKNPSGKILRRQLKLDYIEKGI